MDDVVSTAFSDVALAPEKHYGLFARTSGSVPSNDPPDGRDFWRARRDLPLCGLLWPLRGVFHLCLDLQVLLRTNRTPCRWRGGAAGHGHRHAERVRGASVDPGCAALRGRMGVLP